MFTVVLPMRFDDSDDGWTEGPEETMVVRLVVVVSGGGVECVSSVPLGVCGEVDDVRDVISVVNAEGVCRVVVGDVLLTAATEDELRALFVITVKLVAGAALVVGAVTTSAAEERVAPAKEQTASKGIIESKQIKIT